jgi:hypothetical protein
LADSLKSLSPINIEDVKCIEANHERNIFFKERLKINFRVIKSIGGGCREEWE